LGRRGKTILLSSHLLADVEDVCDRMVILYSGKIRAEGTTNELLSDTNHTVIRTPRLKPETIGKIEEVLQAEGSGIDSVEAPRQKLEELFMGIVQKAVEEHVVNEGAVHGGETAGFLRDEEGEGDVLIESLQRDEPESPAKMVQRTTEKSKPKTASADEVLTDLLEEKPEEPAAAQQKTEVPDTPDDVDSSVIEGLLGEEEADGKKGKKS